MRREASAIPVGGHTAVALACTKASESPSFPDTKYTTARATICSSRDIQTGRSEVTGFALAAGLNARRVEGALTVIDTRKRPYAIALLFGLLLFFQPLPASGYPILALAPSDAPNLSANPSKELNLDSLDSYAETG